MDICDAQIVSSKKTLKWLVYFFCFLEEIVHAKHVFSSGCFAYPVYSKIN